MFYSFFSSFGQSRDGKKGTTQLTRAMLILLAAEEICLI